MTRKVRLDHPIKGCRSWGVVLSHNGLRLTSSFDNDNPWPVLEPFVARCGDYHRHQSPSGNCDCGIHAYKGPQRRAYCPVWGEVNLWGKWIEHTHGWRAEYAYPLRLTGIGCNSCHKLSGFSGAYSFVSIGDNRDKRVGSELLFICHQCYLQLPTAVHRFLYPAILFIEQLEREYGLDRIPVEVAQ